MVLVPIKVLSEGNSVYQYFYVYHVLQFYSFSKEEFAHSLIAVIGGLFTSIVKCSPSVDSDSMWLYLLSPTVHMHAIQINIRLLMCYSPPHCVSCSVTLSPVTPFQSHKHSPTISSPLLVSLDTSCVFPFTLTFSLSLLALPITSSQSPSQ